MLLSTGMTFTGVHPHFDGRVEVLSVCEEKDLVTVRLTKKLCGVRLSIWFEDWLLSATLIGFDNGWYVLKNDFEGYPDLNEKEQ